MSATEVEQSLWTMSIDMLATANLEGYLTRVSPSWQTTLGYTPDELMARPYLDFVHPDDVEPTLFEARALLAPGHATVSFENRYRAKDGSYRWLAWNARTNLDGTAIYTVVRDVTAAREAAREREQFLAELSRRDLMLTGVIDNTMTLVYVKDLDGRYLLYNRRFAEAFGLDGRGAAEGRSGLEVLLGRDDVWLDPELQPIWRENDVKAATGPHFIKEWADHPTLGHLTYDSYKFPLVDADGVVYATCGVSLNTTDHVRAIAQLNETLEALRQGELRTRAILEGSNDAFLSLDAAGLVRYWNPRAEDMFGWTAAEVLGRSPIDVLIPNRHQAQARRDVASLLRVGRPAVADGRAELVVVHRDGRELPVEASMSHTTGVDGPQLHAFLRDISARREIERTRESLLGQEREQVRRFQELDRIREDFVAVVSHELRTPLTSVVGYLDLILEEPALLAATHAKFLEVARRNTSRLERLVDDLLTVFRLDSNKLVLERVSVDLSALTHEALDTVRPAAARSDVSLRVAVEDGIGIVGDADRLAQVVDNLISNAVKYTPDGGDVEVLLTSDGVGVTLAVTDTGIGIPADEQGRLFERFFRSSLSQQRAIQGTGLGLVIARSIVESHAGTLTVQSTEGVGSSFTVKLPLSRPPLAA